MDIVDEGPISGFVKLQNLHIDDDGEHGAVKGMVVSASAGKIHVQLFGSFFTTAQGMAKLPYSDRVKRFAVA